MTSAQSAPLSTPLQSEHDRLGATSTDFAGWRMPLRFGGDLAEHHAVRGSAGLFDLSHMAQLEVTGSSAGASIDRCVVSRIVGMPVGRARYTMVPTPDGGVADDVIVYRTGELDYLVIANAGNRLVVRDVLASRALPGTTVADRTIGRSLVAIQGPMAASILQTIVAVDVAALRYYTCASATALGVPALVARTGYTGEDGFEIAIDAETAPALWRALLAAGAPHGLVPAGLAARDTLRLEAGMPLYGHEIDRTTHPTEVGLRRVLHVTDADGGPRDVLGLDALAARADQPGRLLVGLAGEGRRAARAGYGVFAADDASLTRQIGVITSGVLSPTLGHPVAMALLEAGLDLPEGGSVLVDVRGAATPMTRVPLPFYRRAS